MCSMKMFGTGGGVSPGENFAGLLRKVAFPWRNFGVIDSSFTTAAGIVFPEKGQAQLRTNMKLRKKRLAQARP